MKKLLLSFLMISFTIVVNAQQDTLQKSTDSTLQQYTGKYKYPEGTPFPEVVVTLDKGVLIGTSILGIAELKRIEKDVFEIVGYGGTATFKRNAESKIISCHILVSDIDANGTKVEEDKVALVEIKRE